ncbi:hypothetical protein BKA67DRAFT_585530 [Truncatella angustata]|uniref:Uncharacterized protein n=1 Tax=Truncatella angustata TaxID=152316 RepID=A0A9P8UBM1_9PEZI|nr:uncharacterized protein BKA67DRAFT_585530 [Truncatella angustata]KAH6645561.1 hypothetical protein BKA67DRAFT_585530 [Truncatella angustata]KAH8194353.1 hypothetical protein TruAng_011481 [Truncatella angustata]
MLRSIFTFTILVITGSTFPVVQETSIAVTCASNLAIPVEVSGACYYPSGNTCPTIAQKLTDDKDDGRSRGLVVQNKDIVSHTYFVYKNNCDCMPVKYITIPGNDMRFVSFSAGFQGRMTRGTESANLNGKYHLLGTWVEFSWDTDGTGWADVSLIKGCDGAVDMVALDENGAKTGFSDNVLSNAPTGSYKQKAGSGAVVIMETESRTDPAIVNKASRDWLAGKLGYAKAYIDDYHGHQDICSVNGRFHINFYKGRH